MQFPVDLKASWTSTFTNKNEYFEIGYNNHFAENAVHDFSSLIQNVLSKRYIKKSSKSQFNDLNDCINKEDSEKCTGFHQITNVERKLDENNERKINCVQNDSKIQTKIIHEKNPDLENKSLQINEENFNENSNILNKLVESPTLSILNDFQSFDHFSNSTTEMNIQYIKSNQVILNSDCSTSIYETHQLEQESNIIDNFNDIVKLRPILDDNLEYKSIKPGQLLSVNGNQANYSDVEHLKVTKNSGKIIQLSEEFLTNQIEKYIEIEADIYFKEETEEPRILVGKNVSINKSEQLNIDLFNSQNISKQISVDKSDQETIFTNNYYIFKLESDQYDKNNSLQLLNKLENNIEKDHYESINNKEDIIETQTIQNTKEISRKYNDFKDDNLKFMISSDHFLSSKNLKFQSGIYTKCENEHKVYGAIMKKESEFPNIIYHIFNPQLLNSTKYQQFSKPYMENDFDQKTRNYINTHNTTNSGNMGNTGLEFELNLLNKLQSINNLYNNMVNLEIEPVKFSSDNVKLPNDIIKKKLMGSDFEYKKIYDDVNLKTNLYAESYFDRDILSLNMSFNNKLYDKKSVFKNKSNTQSYLNLKSVIQTTGIHRCHLFSTETLKPKSGQRKNINNHENLVNSILIEDRPKYIVSPLHTESYSMYFQSASHQFNRQNDSPFCRNCFKLHFSKSNDVTKSYPYRFRNSYLRSSSRTYHDYSRVFHKQNSKNVFQESLNLFRSNSDRKNRLFETDYVSDYMNFNRSMKLLTNGNQEKNVKSKLNLDNENCKRLKHYCIFPFMSNTINTRTLDKRVYCRGKLIYDPQSP